MRFGSPSDSLLEPLATRVSFLLEVHLIGMSELVETMVKSRRAVGILLRSWLVRA
jgi:hypothetical protein